MAPEASESDPNDRDSSRSKRKSFLIRLPPSLMEELRAWAAKDLRSLNGHIEFLLREAVKRRRGGAGGSGDSGG